MSSKFNLKAASSLFVEKFSDRSGLVRKVTTANSIFREFEMATRTKYCSNKTSYPGFGNSGK